MRSSRISYTFGAAVALLAGFLSPTLTHAQEQIVEKIPLQYVDARSIALLLGGRILPTEADLWMGRGGAGFGQGANGPVGGGVGPGTGILADPATNSLLMLPGGQVGGLIGGSGLYGDPRTNSLLVGPQSSYRGLGSPAPGRIYGAPGPNALLYRYAR